MDERTRREAMNPAHMAINITEPVSGSVTRFDRHLTMNQLCHLPQEEPDHA
jgi:hypothetical protein